MNKILITFCLYCLTVLSSSAQEAYEPKPSEYTKIMIGRSKLIDNDFSKFIIKSNNDLCKSFVQAYQSDILTLRKYNDYLESRLKECKCK